MVQARSGETGTLTVPGQLESLEPIGEHVVAAATAAGIERRAVYKLRLAVDEIATNIITHGYEEAGREGDVVVHTLRDDRALTVILEDTGVPFDPHTIGRPPQLDVPVEQRNMGGLGVFLAIEGVDEFRYEYVDGKNRNIFVVKTPAAQA